MLLRLLTWTLLLAALAGVALWMGRDHPRVRALWPAALPALPTSAAPAARTRKCVRVEAGVGEGAITYTNDACPPGTREQALQGGTVSVLPAPPAPAASPAQAPLRRLAGEGQPADGQQRRIDEALQR
jgi:hypothetical protein